MNKYSYGFSEKKPCTTAESVMFLTAVLYFLWIEAKHIIIVLNYEIPAPNNAIPEPNYIIFAPNNAINAPNYIIPALNNVITVSP